MRPQIFNFAARPLALMISTLCLAQSAYATDEDVFFTDVPTVYSASRMPQVLSEAPSFVTVIDRDMIRASGARAVSDLLRLVPGFQVTSRNLEMPARVSYHGLSSEDFSQRLQVLIDGRSQYSALFQGGVNWDILPVALEDIERIEVVRGSNVAAYGTNAFMGVVNIITMDASQTRGTTVSANMGNGGVHDEFVRFGGQIGQADLRISYRQQGDDGIRFIPQSGTDPRSVGNGQSTRLFDLRADVPLNLHDELRISLGKIEGRYQTGRRDDLFLNPPRTHGKSSQYAQLEWRRDLGMGDELAVRFHSTEDRLEDQISTIGTLYNNDNVGTQAFVRGLLAPLGQFNVSYSGVSVRDELELLHTVTLADSLRSVWGLGTRQEKVTSPIEFHDGSITRHVRRLFGQMEWRPTQAWLLNFGGSVDSDSLSKSRFSPRVNLSHYLSADHVLRFGMSRAHRIPTMFEQAGYKHFGIPISSQHDALQTTYKARSGVSPEQLDTVEIGYYGDLRQFQTKVDIRVFEERISNRVQILPFTDGKNYAVNAESVRITGAEYQLKWQPLDRTQLILGQSAVQIAVDGLDYVAGAGDKRVEREAQTQNSAPALSSSLMLMQKLPFGLDFSLIYTEQSPMRWTPNASTGLPAYARTDWRLAYPFKLGATRGELAYVVQSFGGGHAELKPSNWVEERHWLSVRFDL